MASLKLSPSEVVAVASRPTDRPWQSLNDYEPHTIIGNVDGGYGDDGTEVRYTNACEIADNDDAVANTALILAAPDLLAACKIALARMEEIGMHEYKEADLFRAAIAKAEGR